MSLDGRVPRRIGGEHDHGWTARERERRISALAVAQHGVVSLAQLRSLGLSDKAAHKWAARRRLHRIHRGVYALGRADLPVEGHWMAAAMACGEGAVLSHWSAATLHELISSAQTTIDVTIPRRVALSRHGLRIHRATSLNAVDCVTVNGIPCTSIARTLLDLASVAPDTVLERACDQAEVLRLLDMAAIDELLTRCGPRPGVGRLRSTLEPGTAGEGVPKSKLERRLRGLCRRHGLPEPEMNAWMPIPGEEIQVDFLWRGRRLIVEVDGYETHRTRLAFQRHRRRDRILRRHGWEVIRFTWEDVTQRRRHVAEVLRGFLSGALPRSLA